MILLPRPHVPSTFITALVLFLSILGCALKQSVSRRLLFIPLTALSFYFIFFAEPDTILLHHTQGLGHVINLIVMSDLWLLTPDVQHEFRKKTHQFSTSISDASFSERMKWAADLYTSYRRIGWEQHSVALLGDEGSRALSPDDPQEIPTVANYRRYFRQQAVGLCQTLAVYTLGDIAIQINPSFQRGGPPFTSQAWWLQPTVVGHMMVAGAYLSALYWVGNTLTVAAGVCEPFDWHPLFGSFWDAYTVNGFWGRAWHQVLRRSFTVHSKFVANKVNPTSKLVRQFLKCFVIFFMSAFMHFISDFTIIRRWDSGALAFFMLQPVAIVLELSLSALYAKYVGIRAPRWVIRVSGYTWVVVWLTLTLPIRLEPLVQVGVVSDRWHSSIVCSVADRIKGYISSY